MSTSPSPASAVSFKRTRKRLDGNCRSDRHDPQYQKQRLQRATWACERCRIKKLRCTGGHPCSSCRRAEIECDFGDRGDPQQSSSITNQRLSKLEKTVTDLVTGLSHLTSPQQTGAPFQSSARPSSPCPAPGQVFPVTSADLANASHQTPGPEATPKVHDTQSRSLSVARTSSAPASSFVGAFAVTPPSQSQGGMATSGYTRTSPLKLGVSEGLDSRWEALQHSPAPFPPLMSHPTVWSGEPAKTSPQGDPTAQLALGMTHYRANVGLQSEPVSEGIVSELGAKALFALFFQKCHPTFPLLGPFKDCDSHFDHIRSSSPFLLTAILTIGARYYTLYREVQSAISNLPVVTVSALEALADLAGAHLGFVLCRKQHELSDVQATLLLSVWIPRGNGQSPDQWLITGLSTRLAYRIGVPDSFGRPVISRFLASIHFDSGDVNEVNCILPQWHTWYDISLSLGFGRPHVAPFTHGNPQQYLAIARKLGSLAQVDLTAATYVTSLAELSAIVTDLVSGLRTARLQSTPGQNTTQPVNIAWSNILALLSELNPRLDEWQRQWTWSGSYDAIALGQYAHLAKIYGEHARLCLNSLSLNLIMAGGEHESQQSHVAISCLARACEATVTLIQYYTEPSGAESVIRYGMDYLVLILGQAAMFCVRLLVARLEQPLPIDRLVLAHYLKKAVNLLESNNLSTTNVCGWVAQLSRDLARYAGISFDTEVGPADANLTVMDPPPQELEWNFDICALLTQNIPAGETGLDLSHYFDFP
ncbi:uncharacterized protein TrAFT101_006423 [Trichoderma asperellum]|uniref:uncharacterized protein n=1 Tax=Trichoderma asperellum TaxID=101201 RepID=UPI0033299DA1|nr:hypothetical protein TrAFT101_006423 [Trichoderma asperellum]